MADNPHDTGPLLPPVRTEQAFSFLREKGMLPGVFTKQEILPQIRKKSHEASTEIQVYFGPQSPIYNTTFTLFRDPDPNTMLYFNYDVSRELELVSLFLHGDFPEFKRRLSKLLDWDLELFARLEFINGALLARSLDGQHTLMASSVKQEGQSSLIIVHTCFEEIPIVTSPRFAEQKRIDIQDKLAGMMSKYPALRKFTSLFMAKPVSSGIDHEGMWCFTLNTNMEGLTLEITTPVEYRNSKAYLNVDYYLPSAKIDAQLMLSAYNKVAAEYGLPQLTEQNMRRDNTGRIVKRLGKKTFLTFEMKPEGRQNHCYLTLVLNGLDSLEDGL